MELSSVFPYVKLIKPGKMKKFFIYPRRFDEAHDTLANYKDRDQKYHTNNNSVMLSYRLEISLQEYGNSNAHERPNSTINSS